MADTRIVGKKRMVGRSADKVRLARKKKSKSKTKAKEVKAQQAPQSTAKSS